MKKRAKITCMCDKAGINCKVCAQGAKIKPDRIYQLDQWTWAGKTFKTT